MNKDDVVHIQNRIPLNHKKEQKKVTCKTDGTRDYHTKYGKSEREISTILYHLHGKSKT